MKREKEKTIKIFFFVLHIFLDMFYCYLFIEKKLIWFSTVNTQFNVAFVQKNNVT